MCLSVYEHLGEFLDVLWHAQLFQSVFFKTKPSLSAHKQRCVSVSQSTFVRIRFTIKKIIKIKKKKKTNSHNEIIFIMVT